MGFHPFLACKEKVEPLLEVILEKIGPVAFDLISGSAAQISETAFKGNKQTKHWGVKLLALHEYHRVDRPKNCQWMKSVAAGIITDGRSEWKTHNTPEMIYHASVAAVMECRVHLGMKTQVLQVHKSMIESKQKELEDMKKIFREDTDLINMYENLITAVKTEVAKTKGEDAFWLFKRQKDIEFALNGKGGTDKQQFAVFYGVYGLKVSPNEFNSIEDYLREVATQNRKLLTDPMKREYLQYLLQLIRDLPLDEKFRGNLEYKINRPISAVFGVEMTLAFDHKNSPEESKQAAIQYILQEIEKLTITAI
eukprot:TRINITY_DN2128_c0_g1_i4.p1 TRINITY_DN2128_c0_g1~~TRINITY_DN2128_c0_g1_i4.p1  ORF type:complete len:334 (+),score=51.73 TRINITY_DN2128_c0_g1_i4:78-1004(+)